MLHFFLFVLNAPRTWFSVFRLQDRCTGLISNVTHNYIYLVTVSLQAPEADLKTDFAALDRGFPCPLCGYRAQGFILD